MTKLLFAGLITLISFSAFAEINCLIQKGEESIGVRIIDTFIDRTAFITRTHPSVRYPIVGISVVSFEKTNTISFINQEQKFYLSIDKVYFQRRFPALYQAELYYGDVSTEMDCTIE